MTGLSRHTAERLGDEAHLMQSIGDILSTPKGSRVLRRDYGSDLPLLIDAPVNGETIVDLYWEAADALDRWESRFQLRRVEITAASAGRLDLTLTGDAEGVEVEIAAVVGATA